MFLFLHKNVSCLILARIEPKNKNHQAHPPNGNRLRWLLARKILLVNFRAFIYAVAACRRPPVSAPPPGCLRRAWPVLFGCLRVPDERPAGLSRTPYLRLLSTQWPHSLSGGLAPGGRTLYSIEWRCLSINRGSLREERLQAERRLPNRVEDSLNIQSPGSPPDRL